jgi:hypothetical protein
MLRYLQRRWEPSRSAANSIQSGGFQTIASVMRLGRDSGSTGYYELSGTGVLISNGQVNVGSAGFGTFVQSGGTYTVSASPFAPLMAYSGNAKITQLPAPPPPSTLPPPRYTNYTPPAGVGTSAGEPSIGVDQRTGKVMYVAGTETLRVSFNDCSSPASGSWEDVSALQTSQVTFDPILYTDPTLGRTFVSQLLPTKLSLMAFTDNDGKVRDRIRAAFDRVSRPALCRSTRTHRGPEPRGRARTPADSWQIHQPVLNGVNDQFRRLVNTERVHDIRAMNGNRVYAQRELGRNRPIRVSFANQPEHVEFPCAECPVPLAFQGRARRDTRIDDGLALRHPPNGRGKIQIKRVLQNVAARTSRHRLAHQRVFRVHAEHQNRDVRRLLQNLPRGGDAVRAGHRAVHHDHLGLVLTRQLNRLVSILGFADDGDVLERGAANGLTDGSTWARGQAWAVHGLVSAARATGEPELRKAARHAARWFVDHLPADLIPPWDFDAPTGAKDASAAAIVASALLDLGWDDEAERLLDALVATSLNDGDGDGLLLHCCYRHPIGLGLDCATAWGDFFLFDALVQAAAPELRLDPLS